MRGLNMARLAATTSLAHHNGGSSMSYYQIPTLCVLERCRCRDASLVASSILVLVQQPSPSGYRAKLLGQVKE